MGTGDQVGEPDPDQARRYPVYIKACVQKAYIIRLAIWCLLTVNIPFCSLNRTFESLIGNFSTFFGLFLQRASSRLPL